MSGGLLFRLSDSDPATNVQIEPIKHLDPSNKEAGRLEASADTETYTEGPLMSLTLHLPMQDEPVKRKKPAVKASKAARTPKQSAQKPQPAAKTPATGGKTPGQLPAAKPPQPRSSAQAKKAASAMQKALAEGDAVMPSGKEASTGEHSTVFTTAACCSHGLVSPRGMTCMAVEGALKTSNCQA